MQKMIPHEYYQLVKKHFRGDDRKAMTWFQTIHGAFGMLSPLNMIKFNREQKVMDYIRKEMG